MTRLLIPLLLSLSCADVLPGPGAASSPTSKSAQRLPLVRGLSIGLYHDTPKLPYAQAVRELRAHGANFVNFVVHWYQTDIRAADLAPDAERTPKDETILAALRAARTQGLHVMVMPIIQLRQRAKGEWRGKLAPTDAALWQQSYVRFLTHYARLAAQVGAAVFCVGSELVSLEGDRLLWSSIIERVRAVFPGALTYSANWDHYEPPALWDLLDLVGVNGYFEVARDAAPTVSRMAERWADLRVRLEAFAAKHARPLLLTEVGYPSLQGGATWPWHYGREAPVDLVEQANAYRAFIQIWRAPSPAFRGVFFWNWEGLGGPLDAGYTPRGKPAAALLQRWYGEENR